MARIIASNDGDFLEPEKAGLGQRCEGKSLNQGVLGGVGGAAPIDSTKGIAALVIIASTRIYHSTYTWILQTKG